MSKIPIVYNEPVKLEQMPKKDVGELLSDCLQELVRLCFVGSVNDQTFELIKAINEYFALCELEETL